MADPTALHVVPGDFSDPQRVAGAINQYDELIRTAGPFINVMRPPFRAKGDGIKDDTAAIQAAIDSLDNSYTGTILLPGGHVISSTLVVRNLSIRFMGLGWGNSSSPTKGSYLKWNGAAGIPMLSIFNCWGTSVKSLRFIGKVATPPSEAIKFTQDLIPGFGGVPWTSTGATGAAARLFLEDLWIGNLGGSDPLTDANGQFVNGITYAGTQGGDNSSLKNIVISGCTAYGCFFGNPQAGNIYVEGLSLGFNNVGLYTKCLVVGDMVDFEGSTTRDMELDLGGIIDFRNCISESAPQHVKFIGGFGALTLRESGFQLTTNLIASGKVIDASSVGGGGYYINLEDWALSNPSGVWSGPTPLISARNPAGGIFHVYLRVVGCDGVGPQNIDVQSVVGQNDSRTIIYEPSPVSLSTPLVPRQALHCGFDVAEDRGFQSWRNDFAGKINLYGGALNVRQLNTPVFPSATASLGSGATVYSYQVTALTRDGETVASAVFTCTNGPALGVSNHNTIAWTPCLGAYAYNIYGRIAGSIGLLATVTWDNLFTPATGFSGYSYVDAGSPAPGVAAPTKNTTGNAVIEGTIFLPGIIQVAVPNNANAATAGVPLHGLYASTADPATVYVRTV